MDRLEKGEIGEKLSSDYLISKGYSIDEKNYRGKYGEIDIIASYKEQLVFIEVKARTSIKYGYPREAVNFRKQEKIIKTSYEYIIDKDIKNRQIRYDVMEVDLNNLSINHIEDAFSALI